MPAPDLDETLTRSDPWSRADAVAHAGAVRDLVSGSRSDRPERRRRPARSLWIAPLAVIGGLALTAGALVAADDLLHADLPIPIAYTTETGRAVSCTATIEGGSFFAPREEQVVAYYRGRDFGDIGQRIYDYALVLAGDRAPTPGVLPRSSQVTADDHGDPYADTDAFSFALTSFLLTDAQLDLGIQGSGDSWLSTDCTGLLR